MRPDTRPDPAQRFSAVECQISKGSRRASSPRINIREHLVLGVNVGRSPAFRRLQRVRAIAEYADRFHLSSLEATQRFQDELLRTGKVMLERNGGLQATRRDLLKGLGAAALVGVGASAPVRRARAARPDKSGAKIAIVGAGMAGLACAYELQGWGVAASVFDAATDGRGGRVRSYGGAFGGNAFPGQVGEMGGELIDTLHTTMKKYVREFGLQLEDLGKYTDGDTFWYADGRVAPEHELVEEYRAFVPTIREDLKRIGPPTADDYSPDDEYFDYLTLAEYLDSRGAGPILRDAIDSSYGGEYGLEIEAQSSLNLLLFIHPDRRSWFQEFGVFSDERYHVVGGNEQIPAAMRESLGDQITWGAWLLSVRKTPGGQYELTFQQDGGGTFTHTADFVVLATPFSTLRHVELDASLDLPGWKQYAIDNLVYGTNAKTMIGFNGRPWEDHGCSGVIYANLPNLQGTWETNPSAAGPTSILTEYSFGARGASLSQANLQSQVQATLSDLDRAMPGISAQARRQGGNYVAVLQQWASQPTQLGSYTCNHPGYYTTICDNEGKTCDRLLFAGEHADSFYEWQGFMEGAANSGLRCADEIVRIIRHPHWNR